MRPITIAPIGPAGRSGAARAWSWKTSLWRASRGTRRVSQMPARRARITARSPAPVVAMIAAWARIAPVRMEGPVSTYAATAHGRETSAVATSVDAWFVAATAVAAGPPAYGASNAAFVAS